MFSTASRLTIAAAAAGLVCLAGPSAADAALVLTINGATTVTDGGAGDIDATANGTIVYNSPITGFDIEVTVASSNSPGNASNGVVQLSSLFIKSLLGTTATATLNVSDTNFTLPGGPALSLASNVSGTFSPGTGAGASVTFRSFADAANAQPATGTSTPLLTFNRSAPGTAENFGGSNAVPFVRGAGSYSMANTAVFVLTPNGQINLSGTTSVLIPEPTTLAGLAAAGLLLGRRRAAR